MKIFNGTVTSVKQNKTVVVEVSRKVAHPMYKKLLIKSKKFQADLGGFTVEVGMNVKIGETRQIAKNKYFKIVEVLK